MAVEEVIFSKGQGLGYISTGGRPEGYTDEDLNLGGELLRLGQLTTLEGLFDRFLEYAGTMVKDGSRFFILKLGNDCDLLESRTYYLKFLWLSRERIATMYTYSSGRDYNYVKGKWK